MNGAALIYVVDQANKLLSFNPEKLPGDPFRMVGQLACEPGGRPFSMAVDRRGVAWVGYTSGNLYRVSIVDARCSPVVFTTTRGAPGFGMGFVTDGPDQKSEKLFVATRNDLARLDVAQTPPSWNPVGAIEVKHTVTNGPELTGTSEGKLFGYFPETGRGFVQELDPGNGKALGPRLELPRSPGEVRAYAFAHWGGIFYVFTTTDDGTAVHAVNRTTGKSEVVRDDVPYPVVGAGVSTCAPALERPL